jgi:hypothetical protein
MKEPKYIKGFFNKQKKDYFEMKVELDLSELSQHAIRKDNGQLVVYFFIKESKSGKYYAIEGSEIVAERRKMALDGKFDKKEPMRTEYTQVYKQEKSPTFTHAILDDTDDDLPF